MGKTQLTIAYAPKYWHIWSATVRVSGNSTLYRLRQSLAGFAWRAGVSGISHPAANTAQQAADTRAKADSVLMWLALESKQSRYAICAMSLGEIGEFTEVARLKSETHQQSYGPALIKQ